MPYWIHSKIKASAVSVIVETAQDALAKIAELVELGHTEVLAKDLSGKVIDMADLQKGAGVAR